MRAWARTGIWIGITFGMLAACTLLSANASAAPVHISITGIQPPGFSPATQTVHRGDDVDWHNGDTITHNAEGGPIHTGDLAAGATSAPWMVPASQSAGDIAYVCNIHPSTMSAKLTVANLAPTVTITSHASGASVSGTITVGGTVSDDVSVASLEVTLGTSTAQASISGTSWSVSIAVPGSHGDSLVLKAHALDGEGAVRDAQVNVVVNVAPAAAFTFLPAAPSTADTVQFTDASVDDHQVGAWAWDFGDGSTSAARNASHHFAARGSYTVKLNITDDHGLASLTQQVVTVANGLPNGTFTWLPERPAPNETVAFVANVTDADGTIANLAWEFGDGTNATGASVNHTYTAAGSYAVNLTALDNEGGSNVLRRIVPVGVLASLRPILNLTANLTAARAPIDVNFTLNGADPDVNGTIVNWTLDFGDGASERGPGADLMEGMFTNHTYRRGGLFEVVLTALDDTGTTGTARLALNITPPPNVPPVVTFLVTPTKTPTRGQVVRFTDTTIDSDAGDHAASWEWDFGDASPHNCCGNATVDHIYDRVGAYTVTLTVLDTNGGSGLNTATITVPGETPRVLLSANRTSGPAPLLVGFLVDARDDGRITRWKLDFGDTATPLNGTGAPPNTTLPHLYDAPGNFAALLEVTDDDGLTVRSPAVTIAVAARNEGAVPLPPDAISATPTDQRLTYRFVAAATLGTNVTFRWDFGDGGRAAGRDVVHTFDAPGPYEIKLTVETLAGAPVAQGSSTVNIEESSTLPTARVTIERGSGVVRLHWAADPRAAGYQVWRQAGDGRFEDLSATTGTTYSDFDVADGVGYTYAVTFYGPGNEGRLTRLSQLNNTQAFRLLGEVPATGFVDTDNDGVGDSADAFPQDASRSTAAASPILFLVAAAVLAAAGLLGWRYRARLMPSARPLGAEAYPLTVLPGLAPEHADLLRRAGILTTLDLARADPRALGKRTILGPRQLERWQAPARLLEVHGVAPPDAARLASAGLKGPADLARADAGTLAARVGAPERLARKWVEAARRLAEPPQRS
jgi:PKD repeat protein